MQSNIDCIMDDLNDFPDSWVELYNPGSIDINLHGYALGLEKDFASAYILNVDTTIATGSYLLIYCDKVGTGLHADFRLESGKGEIYLFNKTGKVIDHISHKKMPSPNVAYGRERNNSANWGYMLVPTPGDINTGRSDVILPAPVFSHVGGFLSDAIDLYLTLPEGDLPEGACIYYTLDGSEPTSRSLLAGSDPIHIVATTIVRAKLFAPGAIPVRSVTHSYIYHPRQITLPVVSIVTDSSYLYDEKIGIYVGHSGEESPNYMNDWRRPVNIEYFSSEGIPGFNQLSEFRIQGSSSRVYQQKSFIVYANKRFGTKRFEYDIWNDKPGLGEEGLIKSFMLRMSGSDWPYTHMRDGMIQTLFGKHIDLDWQAYQPAITYINGEYRGIYNLRERSTEDNIFSNYEGLEDIDMIENWEECKAGDMQNFWNFWTLFHTEGVPYEVYDNWVDMKEFINMTILNTYEANIDFPGNNYVMWRPKTDEGKWRWVIKDTDFGAGLFDRTFEYNYLNYLLRVGDFEEYANFAPYVMLFQNLLKLDRLQKQFIDCFAVYLGDFLAPDFTEMFIDSLQNNIAVEYPYHQKVYNYLTQDWEQEVKKIKDWHTHRTPYMYKHLREFFNLGCIIPVSVERSHADVTFNGVSLSRPQFNGNYYAGLTVSLSAKLKTDSFQHVGWRIDYRTTEDDLLHTIEFNTPDIDFKLLPSYTGVSFKVLTELSGIDTLYQKENRIKISVKDRSLYLNELPEESVVNITDCAGRMICQHRITDTEWAVKLPGAGVYLLSVTGRNGRNEVRKIVVQ